jgi:hypothetical protein
MTIISKELTSQGFYVYIVKSDIPKEKLDKLNGMFVKPKQIAFIIDHDADVYTEDGRMLLRFRKGVLPMKNIKDAYDNMIQFARTKTGARGAASGSKIKDISVNKRIASNIMGYFDSWTIFHKHVFREIGLKEPPGDVRVTRFTADYPDKWNKVIPLIRDIDRMYKKLAPKHYKAQKAKADETAFKIPGTAFSTVTTNLNVKTGIHKDSGNLNESFGNLVVIENGKYDGGYTCYPEYGVGVDVRTGDFLAMDIHQYHGNLPMKKKSKDAERLSLVCYLRQSLWEKSRGSTLKDVDESMIKMKSIMQTYNSMKKG